MTVGNRMLEHRKAYSITAECLQEHFMAAVPIPKRFCELPAERKESKFKTFKVLLYSQIPILKLIGNWNFVSNLKSYT